MSNSETGSMWAPWVARCMEPSVVNSLRVPLAHPVSEVPRQFGTIRLSNVAHQFLAYWMKVRGGKPMPDADDIRPADFREVAPYTRYMKWEGDRLIHRVWGSVLAEALGADLTGTDMFDFAAAEIRDGTRRRIRGLHDFPCGEVAHGHAGAWAADNRVLEFLYLPVAPGADGANRVIGTCLLAEISELTGHIRGEGPVGTIGLDALAYIDTGYGTPSEIRLKDAV